MRTKLLTTMEERDLVTFRERILARGLSTEPIDHTRAEAAYNALLKHLYGKETTTFYWFDSPFAMHDQLRGQLYGQLGGQLRDQLYGQLRGQLYGQLGGQLRGQLYGQLRDQLRDQLYGQLGGQLRDQLYGQLRDQLGGQLGGQLRGQLDQYELQYFMWMDYVAGLEGVEGDTDKLENLRLLSDLGEHSFWIIPLKDGVAFCERPIRISRDNEHNLDSDSAMAIEFPDGWGGYYLRGFRFEQELWQKIANQTITAKEVMGIEDTDMREIALSHLRPDRFLKEVKAKLLGTGSRGTKLYLLPDFRSSGEDRYAMWMKDPSTPREFIEGVPASVAQEAMRIGEVEFCQATAYKDKQGNSMPLEDYLLVRQHG